jgi:peptidoglycan/LPS O-acetylase OafA/YrhL
MSGRVREGHPVTSGACPVPRPVSPSDRYMPGLDGVRAIAVLVVIGYHLNVPWMQGGLLGVGVFFTLSGFLITSLLLESWDRTGGLELRTFWLRRARRLLPALVLVLAAVLAATALVDGAALAERWRESLAGLFFVSNWHVITSNDSYFDLTTGPGPLDHLWSLAVEEQFYLVWPLLLLALLALTHGRLRSVSRLTLLLAAASFVALALLAVPGFDNTRAYEGTDTRAGALLIGAALAMWWRPGHLPRVTRWGAAALDLAGVAALASIALLVVHTSAYSMSLYHGGLLALAIATAVLVAVVAHPASRLGRLLSVAPLRWVGERSYGIYLWHLPVVVFTPVALVRSSPTAVAILQLVVIGLLAALSWSKVEDPIRRHGFAAAVRRPHHGDPDVPTSRARLVPRTVLGGALVSTLVATSVLTASALVERIDPAAGTAAALVLADPSPSPERRPPAVRPPQGADSSTPSRRDSQARPTPSAAPSAAGTRTREASPARDGRPASSPGQGTSCTTVVHVGDSTSLGLLDPAVLAPAQRLDARYRAVGVDRVRTDIKGARSIVERYEGEPNAVEAVQARRAAGQDGCWVMAMGINEVANQVVGGVVPLDDRIDQVMTAIGDAPVLWTTARTLTPSGPWAERGMPAWNDALARACTRYPTMRVYDWAAEVQASWFQPDGIHYTGQGYAERSRRLAAALASAFPAAGEPSTACVVTSSAGPRR